MADASIAPSDGTTGVRPDRFRDVGLTTAAICVMMACHSRDTWTRIRAFKARI
jgi:hypothetical protein